MNLNRAFSHNKIIRLFFILCVLVWLTSCSPMKLPFVIVNNSDEPVTVKYHLLSCLSSSFQNWRDEDAPAKLNADVYFSNAGWQWSPFAKDEYEMTEQSITIHIEGAMPKAERYCVERDYAINLSPKTALRVTVDDYSPQLILNFLDIGGTKGLIHFEQINVWQMFTNIERNPDRFDEHFRSYDIVFNQN